ncbi:uncharacterized protein EV420DRAFT_1485041 [Desarmillaria tabescens]|uniref:Uncharacterized protein n=1 Tax=Armillaria tabescens TaxID=1929756 RepID=A0AA39JIH2_ARMTA|nr:uncharacterized protein EV420DRAFT_1485041 [Desarmillaria tabescens]KAK0443395.1 hypothetical protein EV420DRAFT_1485041 [Desarmillaria tabescens]
MDLRLPFTAYPDVVPMSMRRAMERRVEAVGGKEVIPPFPAAITCQRNPRFLFKRCVYCRFSVLGGGERRSVPERGACENGVETSPVTKVETVQEEGGRTHMRECDEKDPRHTSVLRFGVLQEALFVATKDRDALTRMSTFWTIYGLLTEKPTPREEKLLIGVPHHPSNGWRHAAAMYEQNGDFKAVLFNADSKEVEKDNDYALLQGAKFFQATRNCKFGNRFELVLHLIPLLEDLWPVSDSPRARILLFPAIWGESGGRRVHNTRILLFEMSLVPSVFLSFRKVVRLSSSALVHKIEPIMSQDLKVDRDILWKA